MNDYTKRGGGLGAAAVLLLGACAPGERQEHEVAEPSTAGLVLESGVWTERTPSSAPSPRYRHGMAYDAARAELVVFGGTETIYDGQAVRTAGDTWTWDGTSWAQRCGSGACGPAPRRYAALAYDPRPGRQVTVLVGGIGQGTTFGDTWEWNGQSWQARCTTGCLAPPARWSASLAPTADGVILFGGVTHLNEPLPSTWEWNGASWTEVCAGACAESGPSVRVETAMAYDAARRRVVLFGGQQSTSPYAVLSDTWEWDGQRWERRCVELACAEQAPEARGAHAMAYDAVRGRIVLFGGQTPGGALDDTWEWDGNVWQRLPTSDSPGARLGHGLVSDSRRGELVLFGGDRGVISRETWVYRTRGGACTTAAECHSGYCVDGVCCETNCAGTCEACDREPTPGVCTAVVDDWDADTCAGPRHCADRGRCEESRADGLGCRVDAECRSGFCADGVCCDRACGSGCEACVEASTGVTTGTCAPVRAGQDPRGACAAEPAASCGLDGACDGEGACRRHVQGTECAAASCSGFAARPAARCDGGGRCVAAEELACPGGFACSGARCATTCSSDEHCATTHYCAGRSCERKRERGRSCERDGECASGTCADGVCCEGPCAGPCRACSRALKRHGLDGICENVREGTDEKQDCPDPSAATCLADGLCGADGQCREFAPEGAPCEPTSCIEGRQTGPACNGAGLCSPGAYACAPYVCGGDACLRECTEHADCAANHYCELGACLPRRDDGAACQTHAECVSGTCVDGVCCDTACAGQCEACDVPERLGTCSAVRGEPHGERPPCGGAGSSCAGSCDGRNRAVCSYPDGMPCGEARCEQGQAHASLCNGAGECTPQLPRDCHPYVCGEASCRAECDHDSECVSGYVCEAGSRACIPSQTAGKCSDDQTLAIDHAGDVQKICSPYWCVNGQCATTCLEAQDCQRGHVCDLALGTCVPVMAVARATAEPAADETSGCSCRLGRTGSSTGSTWLLSALAAALLARGRGPRRSSGATARD